VKGAEHFAKFYGKLEKAILKTHHGIVTDLTNMLYIRVRDNISKTPHSKSEFAALGYPFARKGGSNIKPHGHTPLWSVHVEYGMMLKTLMKKVRLVGDQTVGIVGWFIIYPETKWVIEGTIKMISRPVLVLTALEMRLREKFEDRIIKTAVKEIKGMMAHG
jgi:hypothetical protein